MSLAVSSTPAPVLNKSGIQRTLVMRVTGDASYPTGGYDLLQELKRHGLKNPYFVRADDDDGTYDFRYINSTGKLMFMVRASGVECAGTTDVHTVSCRVFAVGQ